MSEPRVGDDMVRQQQAEYPDEPFPGAEARDPMHWFKKERELKVLLARLSEAAILFHQDDTDESDTRAQEAYDEAEMALLAREAALRRELERRETAHRDTIERTEALRERAEKAERERQEADERYIHRDREIAALRAKLAEAERQKEVHERNYQAMYMFKDERDAAVAERDAAREEVKRLRAALRDTFQEYENSDPDCMMGEILARHGIDSAALTQSSTPTTEAEK